MKGISSRSLEAAHLNLEREFLVFSSKIFWSPLGEPNTKFN
jgi:hypothetical protein